MKTANNLHNQILGLNIGDVVWNIGGLAPIKEIIAKGVSAVDNAAYCCFKTQFGSDENTTMSGSIRENRAVVKYSYLVDADVAQFINFSVNTNGLSEPVNPLEYE